MLEHSGVAIVQELLASKFDLLRAEGYEAVAFLAPHTSA